MQHSITYLILIFLLVSCYQDFDETTTTIDRDPPRTTMDSGLTGKAYKYDGSPLMEYSLLINDERYDFKNTYYKHILNLRKFGQVIYLLNGEDIVGFSNDLLLENDINRVDIKAFPPVKSSNISTSQAQVSFNDDFVLNFSRNQLLNTSNNIPEETINVNYFSTNSIDVLSQVGHHGYDSDNNLLVLNSSHLFYIEMDVEGNELLINKETPLSISYNSQTSNLFFLDKQGFWKEVSSDGSYVFDDFGYYLIAESTTGVYNEGVVLKTTKPISYLRTNYIHEFDQDIYTYSTTSLGKWATVNYPGESMSVDFVTPCGDDIDATTYALSDVGQFDIRYEIEDQDKLLNVVTQVIDCSGNVSEIPTINIQSNNNISIYPFGNQKIDAWVPVCEDQVHITGYNILSNESGPLLDWDIEIEDAINFLSHCDRFSNGFGILKIKQDLMVYDSPNIEVEGNKTILLEMENKFRLNFAGIDSGKYDNEDVRMFLEDDKFGLTGYRITCENSPLGCGIDDFYVTHIDSLGVGWTRLTFSGDIWMQTISPPLSGTFPVEGFIMRR